MSEIKAKIIEDVKVAMKARDSKNLTTLRGLVSEIKKVEIDTRKDLDDAGVIAILQKEIKKRRDTIEFAKQAGRVEMVQDNEQEIKLIQNYLGAQLSEEKLKEIITKIIASGVSNIGQIMGALNKDYKGQFEGKVASGIAKDLL